MGKSLDLSVTDLDAVGEVLPELLSLEHRADLLAAALALLAHEEHPRLIHHTFVFLSYLHPHKFGGLTGTSCQISFKSRPLCEL